MTPFVRLEGVAAPLPQANVDTDKILAGRYLKTIQRTGLGRVLFDDLRRDPAFVLNRAPWNEAEILVALDNFGCGSSREHAPWALLDFGIRCVIAPSIADIFYNNCFKNGILPVILPPTEVGRLLSLAADASTCRVEVDLATQTVATALGETFAFVVDAKRKHDLMTGLDEIAASLSHRGEIDEWEEERTVSAAWLRPILQSDLLAD